MQDEQIIKQLHAIARDRQDYVNNKMAACIVYKNRIIAYGFNVRKTHPLATKFQKLPNSFYLHAEVDAIKNALRILDINQMKKASIYVARSKGKDNAYGLAKPCNGCAKCIAAFEIKRIIYTTDEGISYNDNNQYKK